MTKKPATPPETVTLTRAQIYHILVWQMGWEPIDVTSFWRLARKRRP